MAALSTIITRARIKARDTESLIHSDTQLLALANGILEEIYGKLQGLESNLVYAEGTITLAASTMEYTPTFSFNGLMDDGVWMDGEDLFLSQVDEAHKIAYDYATQTSEPEVYYLTEDGKVGFLPVPDAVYTVHAQYWKPLVELTATTGTVPWSGIWDAYLVERLAMEMLGIQERDVRFQAAKADILYYEALNKVYNRGCRIRSRQSDFFTVDGA